ncbi:2-amino-4-hydroxy-6-hydroxymethyldihydropteridine diphosphokinase [Longispora fulva]|uniref:2-amino-4-hydroxy-6-hydroxymethyldihydropteridine diphosphokinase n=1 Tax=Longispora fulva TaxID=619741 RepID=A0A8J7GJE6_9ACTN|nr:2-amino-4-hydroxy-6-hydroxymethyldihydropteridine diphosphokinase [Longispora fulva]MBG6139226.1 2-amino-4-hydroxy-6-hydroxymethyldihydropteridine diphosphokinase [Longispora fulva]GIG58720.1 2-amino-4-hydroxy-6-hydroxymethyldihydropteridine diphosphokinase [Longispora fulva]
MRALLALGSNLGDRRETLRAAVATLGDAVLSASRVYETPPWGDELQPAYLNMVLIVEGHSDWLAVARGLEEAAGRVRDPERRFGPRTLDVDVIMVWDPTPVFSADPELTLPHPRAHLRAFVLVPWLEVDPWAELPGHGFVADLLREPALAADARDVVAVGTVAS